MNVHLASADDAADLVDWLTAQGFEARGLPDATRLGFGEVVTIGAAIGPISAAAVRAFTQWLRSKRTFVQIRKPDGSFVKVESENAEILRSVLAAAGAEAEDK